jgi:ribosome maturation factor RimP
MDKDTIAAKITQFVEELLATDPALFLVEVKVVPTNNFKVFLDGDQGITIEKCVQVNRALYKKIEETALFPEGDFSLEVSSAGLDEPLKLLRQYRKNTGRRVEVVFTDGSRTEGKLEDVTEDGIVVEESKAKQHGKKAATRKDFTLQSYLFNNIKSTKIQIVF